MAVDFGKVTLGLRAVEAIFAIIVLGLIADVVDYDVRSGFSAGGINFMLFNSLWTLLVANPYLTIAPFLSFPVVGHVYALLVVDAVTMIFWFAGFIAVAVLLPAPAECVSTICKSATAATVFGAFSWLVFSITTGFAIYTVLQFHSGGRQARATSTEMQGV